MADYAFLREYLSGDLSYLALLVGYYSLNIFKGVALASNLP